MKTFALVLLNNEQKLDIRAPGNTLPKGVRVLGAVLGGTTETSVVKTLQELVDKGSVTLLGQVDKTIPEKYQKAINYLSSLSTQGYYTSTRTDISEFSDVMTANVRAHVSRLYDLSADELQAMVAFSSEAPLLESLRGLPKSEELFKNLLKK